MTKAIHCMFVLLCMTPVLGAPATAHAAESFDNCTGFVTSLPAVIDTPGTWCLQQNLNFGIASGNAITINSNDVTLDCNNFNLNGLGAGLGSLSVGVGASDRKNIAIRNCEIRGFFEGTVLSGSIGGHHVVEDNLFDRNTSVGIFVVGDGSIFRGNRVLNTGGSTRSSDAIAISAHNSVDVLDNVVSGVVATSRYAFGLYIYLNRGGSISGNRIRGVISKGDGTKGIMTPNSSQLTLRNNELVGDSSAASIGIDCFGSSDERAMNNVIKAFATGLSGCGDDGGNVVGP
jgi:hypothetical protein